MSLPADSLFPHPELHVVMPDGNENVWDPLQWSYAIEKWREIMLVREWHRAGAGGRAAGRWELRLADGMRNWIDPGSNDLLHVSARQPGTYHLWAELEVIPAAGKTPRDAWHGRVRSNAVEINVSDLPIEQRRAELTNEQKRDLEAWLADDKAALPELRDRLTDAVVLTENEALANRLMEVVKGPPTRFAWDALAMLMERCGTNDDGAVGIDGPYLKNLAEWQLTAQEKFDPAIKRGEQPIDNFGIGAIEAVLVYLKLHPDDQQIRDRMTVLAQSNCRLPNHVAAPAGLNGWKRSPGAIPITEAWKALIQLEVLHDGMTVAEAIKILGPPTSQGPDYVSWRVQSPMHVNPVLHAYLIKGAVSRWSNGRA
ncbi:MAG TPA: hypothetical protein VH518_08970 [Tepidisphaeraceae bacterium]